MKVNDKSAEGVIQILCKESGFRYDKRMETTEMLVAFVAVLVDHIADERWTQAELAKRTGADLPSEGSQAILEDMRDMLFSTGRETLIRKAADIHRRIHQVCPDETYPCDHLIDMLSSCVSAIRFGLEVPCKSRHAADAAGNVWRRLYGVSRFDGLTLQWQKDWIRAQIEQALIYLAFPKAAA